jgi:hypothetical protein
VEHSARDKTLARKSAGYPSAHGVGSRFHPTQPPGEDKAPKHRPNAGLLKKNKIMAGSAETFSTAIQFPCIH